MQGSEWRWGEEEDEGGQVRPQTAGLALPGLETEASSFSSAAPFEFLGRELFALQTHHRAEQQETMNSTTRGGRGGGGERGG